MKKNLRIGLLISVLIIAAFFRLYNLKNVPPGLYPDEAMNGSNAIEALETGTMKVFYPENNGREGLFMNIQALFLKAFGRNEPWVLRSASAMFGILTVLGVYFLVCKLLEKDKNRFRIALLSSFLMAGSFWHIIFSRIGFRAIMAPAFLVWSLYILLSSFDREKEIWKRLSLGLLGGAVYGLGMHSYIAYRATPLILIIPFIFLFINYFKKPPVKKSESSAPQKSIGKFAAISLSVIAGITLAILPLISHFVANPADFMGRTSQISVFSSESPVKDLLINTAKTVFMFNFSGDANWRHNFSGYPELSAIVGIFFIVGIFMACKKIFRKPSDSMPEFLMFTWIGVSLLPVIISNEGIPHALRAIITIPAVMIIAAIGMNFLGEKIKQWFGKGKKNDMFFKICVGTVISFLIIEPFLMYFILWGKNDHVRGAFNSNYVEIARAINSLPKETEKYIVVLAGGVKERGIPVPAQTVMFMTDSFTEKGMRENNIRYVLSFDELPESRNESVIFVID